MQDALQELLKVAVSEGRSGVDHLQQQHTELWGSDSAVVEQKLVIDANIMQPQVQMQRAGCSNPQNSSVAAASGPEPSSSAGQPAALRHAIMPEATEDPAFDMPVMHGHMHPAAPAAEAAYSMECRDLSGQCTGAGGTTTVQHGTVENVGSQPVHQVLFADASTADFGDCDGMLSDLACWME